jgi:HAD superfamily hydrolase (TIGR01509 family)
MTIRNLIFDLDGTLIDSSEGVIEAVNYALTQMGASPQPPDSIKKYIGYPLHQMFADFCDAPADRLYAHFQVKAASTVVRSAVPLPNVEETLANLQRRGYAMSIATTKTRAHLDGIIHKLGWEIYFRTSVSGSDVAKPKPDPAAFHLALKLMNCTPESAIVIGDTINDVLAAQAVPMRVVAVDSPYGDQANLDSVTPDFTIKHLPDLLTILNGRSSD